MAHRGRKFSFHGAFGTKAKAVRKERSLGKGAFVRRKRFKGRGVRYMVLKRRKR